MARPDKATAVADLTDEFRSSSGAVLTEYRGLSVKQLQELRRALGLNANYAVVKNTLTKIAAEQAGVHAFEGMLEGPSAIAFIKGDPVEAARSLRDFAKTHPPLVIKGGVLDGKPLTTAEISRIADLESREVLLAKLAGALLASLQNAAYLFNAPLAKAARAFGALQEKAEEDPTVLSAGDSGMVPDVDSGAGLPGARETAAESTTDGGSGDPAESAAADVIAQTSSDDPSMTDSGSGEPPAESAQADLGAETSSDDPSAAAATSTPDDSDETLAEA